MKKVYLIHCWSDTIKDGWYLWLKSQLENSNVLVNLMNIPDSDSSNIDKWISKINDIVDSLDEETYFVGQSIGCQVILRYLETKDRIKIGGILFVAPWFDLIKENLEEESDKVAKPWIKTQINFNKIRQFTNNITFIFFNHDYFVSLEQEQEFKSKLNAKTVIINGKGYIGVEDGVNELAIILIEIGKILKLELIEVVDRNGNSTGEIIDRNVAHDLNILHREVGLFIINSNNQILLQKRSATKRFKPNKWGLCAGHVDAYEDNETAVLRELKEEIGVIANKEDIVYFCTIVKERETNSHIAYAYYMFLDKDEKDFVLQKEELSEVKWIDFKQFKNMVINNDSSITFSNNENNIRLIKMLEEVIKKHDK